jgi:SAM-dependent methyltransferase
MEQNRWLAETGGNRGPEYAQRFRDLESSGADVHGEARTIDRLLRELTGGAPGRVLEAGCGTGRVSLELARRGHAVTGVDLDPSMLREARDAASAEGLDVDLREGDLADLGRALGAVEPFDLVAAPGNVVVYLTPGTEPAVVAALAAVLRPGGLLVAGFSADRHVGVDVYDEWCRAAGLTPVHRWSTWDGQPFAAGGDYVVGVHRR